MSTRYYELGKLIAGLKEYQEVGALLIGEEEIHRCLDASRRAAPKKDLLDDCSHELITLHAGTCDRCGAFFVRPIHRTG